VLDLPDRQVSKAPLMVKDGPMFVTTSQGTILALDPATSQPLWTFKPDTPFGGNRGVGIGEGLLFAGLRNSNVVATRGRPAPPPSQSRAPTNTSARTIRGPS
jgi:outer membrane protein assembly factor BamB